MIASLLLAAALDCGASTFFATAERLTAERQIALRHGIVVRGASVPPTVPEEGVETGNRYLFTLDGQGRICAPPRRVPTAEFPKVWRELRGENAPVPVLVLAEVTGCGKTITLYADGMIVIAGKQRTMRRATPEQLRNIRSRIAAGPRSASGYLSFIPPGLQELHLGYDWGERWTSALVYRRCGPVEETGRRFETPEAAALLDAILEAAGDPRAFDCNCVRE